jgi:hypothetical protein
MGPTKTGIKECILLFNKEMDDDPYHRYYSWEHCYSYFQKLRSSKNSENLDKAILHLAFYLASWGMYRGSSRLLQKDYRVHTRIVEELLESKYDQLWHLDFDTINPEGPEVNLVILLEERLEHIYADLQISPTKTLVTKVLLGTYGCIPAYDELFINGVTYWNQELPGEYQPKFPAHFGLNSYRGLIKFYREHKNDIHGAKRTISEIGMNYPVMKLIDMYFWNLGYQLGR